MTHKAEGQVSQLPPTRQQKHSGPDEAEWSYGYGSYQYCIPAEDQIIAYVEGMRISGTFAPDLGDSQSDDPVATLFQTKSEEFHAALDLLKQRIKEELRNRAWEVRKSLADEEMTLSVAVDDQADDTNTDDVSQWTPDKLAFAIMDTQSESNMTRLREMILFAEDTGFSVEQSEQLAPWLLSFAERYRDSNDPQDEAAVWSAIRTGASMLRPKDSERLHTLLEPGHSIETSLVAVKMVGRIFEAQPPVKVDEYKETANEVYQIATSLLNLYAIASSQSAAMAQLAIYAIAAMASSNIYEIVKIIQRLNIAWFTQQTLNELRSLADIWGNRTISVAVEPCQLLSETIRKLEHTK